MDFLSYIRHISVKDAYVILLYSALGGGAGGALLILYPNAAIHIFDPQRYLFYLLLLPVVSLIFLIAKRLSQKKTAHMVEQNLEDQVLAMANTLRHEDLAGFEKRKRADIHMGIVNARTISQAAAKSMDALEHNITLIIGWLYIFLLLSPTFGWIILVWRLFQYLLREAFQKIIKTVVMEELQEQRNLFAAFEAFLYGFKELKLNRAKSADLFQNHFLPLTERIKALRLKSSFYASELMLFYSISLFVLIACGVFLFFPALSRETTLKIVIMMLYMLKTDIMILSQVPSILEGKAALERLQQLFGKTALQDKEQMLHTTAQETVKTLDSITLENIHFAYPAAGNESGFGVEIDALRVQAGEILFIVGGNGSGKSTLMKIITGLYRPSAGKILVDGRPLVMSEHRYLFATIFNDPYLFDAAYGLEDVPEERINSLLKELQLSHKVRFRDGRFSTLNLSTGQKKRLALALALLEDKPVYVFDEWAADQDPYFRRRFYETILPELKRKGKLIIAVTHDDHYFHTADQIIRLEFGKITDRTLPAVAGPAEAEAAPSPGAHAVRDAGDRQKPRGLHAMPRKRKRPAKTPRPMGLLEQLNRFMHSHGPLIKRLLLLITLVSFALVFIFIVLLSAANPAAHQSRNLLFAQFVLLILLFMVSFRRLNRHFYQSVETRISEFRVNVLERVRKTSLQVLEQIGPMGVYARLTNDIKAIADTSFSVLMSLLGAGRALMTFAYIAVLSLPAFGLIACLLAVGAAFYVYNHALLIKAFEELRHQEQRFLTGLNDLLLGFRELRVNNRKSDAFYENNLRCNAAALRDLKLRFTRYYTNNYTLAYSLWEAMLLSLTLLLPLLPSTSGVLPVLVAMVVTIPLNQIIDRYSQFHTAYMSLQQLYGFEERMRKLEPEAGPSPAADLIKAGEYKTLDFQDCAFRYKTGDGRSFQLGPVSLGFSAGELVFITGGNGSGKSTLLKIMTGLYPMDSGRVQYNGREVDVHTLQELFSAIFSDFYLFNALYGLEAIPAERVNDLLGRFQLDKIVSFRQGKFSTLDLSTGQKKRLAMVIAMLEDRPIYIFDEWAADQDPHFRQYFYAVLLPEFKAHGKTVIVVTHDDRFFQVADRVVKLEYGQCSPTA